MDVLPVAITQPDWNGFVKFVKDRTGVSPTRGLDNQNIAPSEQIAWTAAVDMKNCPLDAINHGYFKGHIFNHTSVSFVCEFDDYETVVRISELSDLKITGQLLGKIGYIAVISGTLKEWMSAILSFSNKLQTRDDLRDFSHLVFTYLSKAGFKDIFSHRRQTTDSEDRIIFV